MKLLNFASSRGIKLHKVDPPRMYVHSDLMDRYDGQEIYVEVSLRFQNLQDYTYTYIGNAHKRILLSWKSKAEEWNKDPEDHWKDFLVKYFEQEEDNQKAVVLASEQSLEAKQEDLRKIVKARSKILKSFSES